MPKRNTLAIRCTTLHSRQRSDRALEGADCEPEGESPCTVQNAANRCVLRGRGVPEQHHLLHRHGKHSLPNRIRHEDLHRNGRVNASPARAPLSR